MHDGNRQVAKMNAPIDASKPDFTALVSSYMGKKLNSPMMELSEWNGNLLFLRPPLWGCQK